MNIRKSENFHILLWLFKDVSWLMGWKVLGTLMTFPTIALAIIIAYNTRYIATDFFHNLAIVFWIIANSMWMLLEFFEFDQYKYYAIIPFAIGIFFVVYYYARYFFCSESEE